MTNRLHGFGRSGWTAGMHRPAKNSDQRASRGCKQQPLRPEENVTDHMLRAISEGEPDWMRGAISRELQAFLVMVLPDICGELMAYRRAAQVNPALQFPAPRNRAEEIANARSAIDDDRSERIEGLTQANADEIAKISAQLETLQQSTNLLMEAVGDLIDAD